MRQFEVGFIKEGVGRMLTVMESIAERRAEAKPAIVVGADVALGKARMVESWAEMRGNLRFRVFRDMAAAREWLGIDP